MLSLLDPEDQIRASSSGQEEKWHPLASPRGQTFEEVSTGQSQINCSPDPFFLFLLQCLSSAITSLPSQWVECAGSGSGVKYISPPSECPQQFDMFTY